MPERAEIERLNRALDNMRGEYMAKLNEAEAEVVALRAARDGTVAVEDVRAMRRLLSRAIGGLECDPAADRERIYYEIVENPALERIDHTLAEFDALAGESNEGGNQ